MALVESWPKDLSEALTNVETRHATTVRLRRSTGSGRSDAIGLNLVSPRVAEEIRVLRLKIGDRIKK